MKRFTVALFVILVCAIANAQQRRTLAYVTSERTGDITIIDTRTMKEVGHYHVQGRARGIRVSHDGRVLYVAVSVPMGQRRPSSIDQDRILAIDAATGRVLHRYNTGVDPERLALDASGERIFVAQEDAGTASIYDLRRDSCIASVVVGLQPEGVGVSPDNRWAYITSEGSNCVSVISARKQHKGSAAEVASLFFVDQGPRDVAFLRTKHKAYVACEIGGSIAVIDTRSHVVTSRIKLPLGSRPMSMVLNSNESKLYVSNGRGNTVSVIDTRTDAVRSTIATGSRTWGIAITPDDKTVFAANSLDNTISVIDAETDRLKSMLNVSGQPWGVAIANAP